MTRVLKIAIVDDDKDILKFYSSSIREEFSNAEIITAENGLEGLGLIIKERPDMMILDINMPKFSGLELLSFIREKKDEYLRKLPVIILTSEDSEKNKTEVVTDISTLFMSKAHSELPEMLRYIEILNKIK